MDAWFINCMLHVTMAMFEYAILLTIKFGKQKTISADENAGEEKIAVKKCRKMDLYALRVFIACYSLSIVIYFYIMTYYM